jgi:branched-chain amino acid aminotransferase
MIAWLNGTLTASPRLDAADRGFTLGDGVFETIRAAGGRPCRLAAHLARLRCGAELLGLPLPDDAALEAALAELLAAAGLADAALRLTVSRGPAPRGLLPPADSHPTVLVTAGPLPPPAPPARLVVATVTRRNEHSPLARIKSLNALDNILARREAAERGADEAVLLNTAGRVAETTIATLFARIDGILVTPPVAEGALPGVARAAVLAGMAVAERPLSLAELRRAEEIVLTNSLGLRRVADLDGVALAGGERLEAALRQVLDAPTA